MGYYRPQGDYYAGYMGDPGIGSFFRGLVTKATSFIPGVGPVVSGVLDKVLPGGARAAPQIMKVPGAIMNAAPVAGSVTAAAGGAIVKAGKAVKSVVVKHPVLSAAGAAGALGGTMGAAAEALLGKHGRRKHRRLNVCNPKALRRAIRRTRGFAKLAMHTIHLVHPQKKARFGGFKRKRKRS